MKLEVAFFEKNDFPSGKVGSAIENRTSADDCILHNWKPEETLKFGDAKIRDFADFADFHATL